MFLTLLQSQASPVVTPPTSTADIGPGDYSSIPRKYPLRGAIKRKRLKHSEVKKIKEVAVSEPSLEQLKILTKELIPSVSSWEIPQLAKELELRLETALATLISGIHEAQSLAILEAQKQKERERVIIETIAQYLQQIEDEEILLTLLI